MYKFSYTSKEELMAVTPEFTKALNALGSTDQERAQALGVSRVTLIEWKKGRYPNAISILSQHIELVRALIRDAEASQIKNQKQVA
jgi:DNA-binding XRE family transcriptional regulator